MDIKRYEIPLTREPFCNTPFVPAGYDPETGEERYWTGTWNYNGMIGALVSPSGRHRLYRFTPSRNYAGMGAYSAVYVGDETMWLISDTSVIRRLDLRTGETEDFVTGAGAALVCAGMPYDEETGKVLFFANTMPDVEGVVFDTRACKVVKHFTHFTKSTGVRGSFPNGDGTYSIWFHNVDTSLWRWDPKTDELVQTIPTAFPDEVMMVHNIGGKHGHYVPYTGWFDGYHLTPEPKPEQEVQTWFAASEEYGYGSYIAGDAIWRWEFATGKVEKFADASNFATGIMTSDGDLLVMSLYGELRRYDQTGALRLCVLLDSEAHGYVDCLLATDNGLIVGTPFITQRFWVFDEKSGKGWDAGKVAPGCGQVMHTWNMNGKIYFSSYTQSMLTEYDPTRPTITPENPRLVAKAPTGMRPVANADDGRCLYYASNHHYGHIGSIMTKYDTQTGQSLYLDNPFGEQHIISLYMQNGKLWGGTTWISDCRCCRENSRDSFLLCMDPETLEVAAHYQAPEKVDRVEIYGETDGGLLLAFLGEGYRNLYLFDTAAGTFTEIAAIPENLRVIRRTGRKDEYVLLRGNKIERWILSAVRQECVDIILEDNEIYNMCCAKANGEPVLCAPRKKEFYVIRDFLNE